MWSQGNAWLTEMLLEKANQLLIHVDAVLLLKKKNRCHALCYNNTRVLNYGGKNCTFKLKKNNRDQRIDYEKTEAIRMVMHSTAKFNTSQAA